jgi:HEAT repeat protein
MRCFILLLLVFVLSLPAGSALAGKAFDVDSASNNDLIGYLAHDSWDFRYDAAREIKRRCVEEADQQLAAIVEMDPNAKVRLAALTALVHCDMPSALVSAEMASLVDAEESHRRKAISIIEKNGTARSAPVLSQVLKGDPDIDTQRKAAQVLRQKAWTGAEPVQKELAFSSEDRTIRVNAIWALWRIDRDKYAELFHERLRTEPDAKARRDLVELIEKAPRAGDKDVLVEMLDDDDPHVARHAARALVGLGDRSVALVLRAKSMDVNDRKVAEEFEEAAEKLGG